MGGNVVVTDTSGKLQRAGRADFRKLNRDQFIEAFFLLFKRLDALHEKSTGDSLWPPGKLQGLLSSAAVFSGSSVHLFNKKLSDEEFVEYKPVVGDIDITIPGEKLESLHTLLDTLQGSQLTSRVKYVGQKPSISHDQINAVFAYAFDESERPLNIQIDFEAVGYENSGPSEFVKFARSSEWPDIKGGVKGVFHKYLLRCLATVLSKQEDVVLLTPASPLEPPEKVKISKVTDPVHLLSFSVDKGLRTSAAQQFLPSGEPLLINGKRAFKKLSTAEAEYHQSRSTIFSLIFGTEPIGNEVSLFGSYTGILQLMQDHLDNRDIEAVYLDFIGNKLYGKNGQALDVFDPKNDMQAKIPAVNVFKQKFPFLSTHDGYLEGLIDEYYKNYKTKVVEAARRSKGMIHA